MSLLCIGEAEEPYRVRVCTMCQIITFATAASSSRHQGGSLFGASAAIQPGRRHGRRGISAKIEPYPVPRPIIEQI